MKPLAPCLVGFAALVAGVVIVVQGGAAAPAGRYTIASGTAYDTMTKLTWEQAASSTFYTQTEAVTHCSTLGLNGAAWRLPTVKELVTIVDASVPSPGPTVDATAFPGAPSGAFWSSTPYAGASGYGWAVYFGIGYPAYNVASEAGYVRCVR